MLIFAKRIVGTDAFRAATVLLIILNICFFPCIWGNKTLLASSQDAPSILPTGAWAGLAAATRFPKTLDNGGPAFLAEPWLALTHYQYVHERVFPLWNPYQGFGHPLAANQEAQPFYPLTLAVMLHVSPRTYNWFILSRLLLAGICCYLYLRFFVSFWPAVAGGVTSMLAGYYVLFISMPQLSVEVLIPASLLAAEYLLRKRSYRSFVGFSILLLSVFLGGMPESALLLLLLLYIYVLFRVLSDSVLRKNWLPIVARSVAATLTGLALSLFFLLPLWELMHRSFDVHQSKNIGGAITGLFHDSPGLSIFTYFFPLIYGPPFTGALGSDFGLRNYFGVVAAFFILVAVGVVLKRSSEARDPLRPLTFFFVGVMLILLAKRYGFPGINEIGALPYLSLVNFPKYEEALVSIVISITAAFGMERLICRKASAILQATAWVLTALIIPLAYLCSRQVARNEVLHLHVPPQIPKLSLELPACLLVLMIIVLVTFAIEKRSPRVDYGFGVALTALTSIEMGLCFIAPVYYWFNQLPSIEHNPYAGAPYINVIRQHQGYYRTFARDGLLFPVWASAFRIYDIRNLDAMYDKKYIPFLLNFLPGQKNTPPPLDLGDRFNGTGPYALDAPLAERLLQLSSVKYIATLRAFTIPNHIVDEILTQNLGRLIHDKEANIVRKEFILGGEARDGLGEHPPYERMPYHFRVGDDPKEILHFSYALDPLVFDKTASDGVEFILELKDSRGKITRLFSKYIDPKHNSQERRWMDGLVDLSAYRGQPVDLLLTTNPGPRGDTSYDWAAWSDFYFVGHKNDVEGQPPPFKLIYNREADIYRYDNVLPRAAIYYHADLARNGNDALHRLADPTLNVFNSVVLNDAALTARQHATVQKINAGSATPVETASIQSYKSQFVEIDASLKRDGILVLNDTDYPGWTAKIDGQPAQMVNANYIFRGVLLPAGRHVVQFVYRPGSFYGGLIVSGLTALALVLGAFLNRVRSRTTRKEAVAAATA